MKNATTDAVRRRHLAQWESLAASYRAHASESGAMLLLAELAEMRLGLARAEMRAEVEAQMELESEAFDAATRFVDAHLGSTEVE